METAGFDKGLSCQWSVSPVHLGQLLPTNLNDCAVAGAFSDSVQMICLWLRYHDVAMR